MALFKKIKPGKMRVLLNAGGIVVREGVSKKMPCRWADFRDKDTLRINDPKDIELMKKASGFGKEFIMIPDKKVIEKKVEHPLKKKTTLVED